MATYNELSIQVLSSIERKQYRFDLDRAIFDLNDRIDLLSSKADMVDLLISAASGLLCGALDILWVGKFDLSRGRALASDKVDKLVEESAKLFGCKDGEIRDYVKFLEERFPIPSDGNTPDFGGGLQHHLRDFAHHPTIVGLIFSLLTQFTGKSYGTDVNGKFLVVNVPERSRIFIGKDTVSKIINGTVIWFFHLVSDIAGSRSTAGLSGGTGIPGPILSLAKELSAIPVFKNAVIGDKSLSEFLSKLFNGTLLAQHNETGTIIKDSVIKFDFRGELGAIAELGRQALPVIANECFVRVFYFIRRLATEIKTKKIRSIRDLRNIEWKTIAPVNSPTLTRMLTVATGVFTTVDIADAVLMQKYWVDINYVGIGRFAVAIGGELTLALRRRDLHAYKRMFATIKQNTFAAEDRHLYERIESDMKADRLGLTLTETEILYNIEYYKVKHDIETSVLPLEYEKAKALKQEWLDEWVRYMTDGFNEFVQVRKAVLHWYTYDDLCARIKRMKPSGTWYKLVLLEAMLFEPYFALNTTTDRHGNEVPSKKYNLLNLPLVGFNMHQGDNFLEEVFAKPYCPEGFIARLRRCHTKSLNELNEVLKTTLTRLSICAATIIVTVFTAGVFAPQIAVALVGSNFAGLSGAALTNACLAYLGGGAIAAGGLGMAGGTAVIVGGGAILGLGAGVGAGGIVKAVELGGKEATIMQSAKLLVSVKEIFLNEEQDIRYSTAVYEQYVESISEIEKGLVELRLEADVATKEKKKEISKRIKNAEESVNAMKIAMKSMNRFISSYQIGF